MVRSLAESLKKMQTENEKLREALRKIEAMAPDYTWEGFKQTQIARAALGEEEDG